MGKIAEHVEAPAQEPLWRHVNACMLDLDVALRPIFDKHRSNPKVDEARAALGAVHVAIGKYLLIDKLLGRHIFDADPAEVLRAILVAALQAGVRWDQIVAAVTTLQEEGHR